MRSVILTTLVFVALSQQPQVDCVTGYGETRCSQTPFGKCVKVGAQVVCGDPSWAALQSGLQLPRVSCITSYGNAACGYDCKASYGQVGCAGTPWGRCVATSDGVTCSDPKYIPYGVEPEPVQCVRAYAETACGYDCKAAYGKVACAQTPWGRCIASYGNVTCADPARIAFRGAPPPKMDCVEAYGKTACGYDCKTAYGEVACARAPWGRCVASYGKIACSP